MFIQNIFCQKTFNNNLKFEWDLLGIPIAISIQLALDSEFTKESRTFVINKQQKSCILNIESGEWFYRMGSWIGTEKDGIIEWSGIYGPITIQSNLPPEKLLPFEYIPNTIQPVQNGIIFHTGIYEHYYMVINITKKEDFKSSGIKTYYRYDWGNTTIQILNLQSDETYSFQLQTFSKDKANLPKDKDIQILTDVYSIKNKKTAKPARATNLTEVASYLADKAILTDSVSQNTLARKRNFSSYTDYLKFMAAKTRNSGS
jgi:hypothetical protein